MVDTRRDQPLGPSQDVGNPALQARRQPSLGPRPVIETWLAIACLAVATRATKRPPRFESHIDLDAAMGDLSREHDPPRIFGDDRHAGRLRPGINLDPMIGNDRSSDRPILEDNREWEPLEDRRAALFKEESRPRHPAGIQRFLVLVNHESMHKMYCSCKRVPPLAGEKLASAMLERLAAACGTGLDPQTF